MDYTILTSANSIHFLKVNHFPQYNILADFIHLYLCYSIIMCKVTTVQKRKKETTQFSGQTKTFLLKIIFDRTGSIRTHSLDDILLNPPPRRQLLQLHPGPSWHSFSLRGLGVHHRTETSGRSRCVSGCPGEPQRRGCLPPACAHCRDR